MVAGEFGFKVEISGQLALWKKYRYHFNERIINLSLYIVPIYSPGEASNIRHTHIISPVEGVALIFVASFVWRWYAQVPVSGASTLLTDEALVGSAASLAVV